MPKGENIYFLIPYHLCVGPSLPVEVIESAKWLDFFAHDVVNVQDIAATDPMKKLYPNRKPTAYN